MSAIDNLADAKNLFQSGVVTPEVFAEIEKKLHAEIIKERLQENVLKQLFDVVFEEYSNDPSILQKHERLEGQLMDTFSSPEEKQYIQRFFWLSFHENLIYNGAGPNVTKYFSPTFIEQANIFWSFVPSSPTSLGQLSSNTSFGVELDITNAPPKSKLRSFFQGLLGWLYIAVPHSLWLLIWLLSLLQFILSGFIVLFVGTYNPNGLYELTRYTQDWFVRVAASLLLLVNEYPKFGSHPTSCSIKIHTQPVTNVMRIDLLKRFFWFIRYIWFHTIALVLRSVVAILFAIISFFSLLLFQKRIAFMFEFNEGTLRWFIRLWSYCALISNTEPKFSGKP